jgi:hypothetical protein
MEDLCAGLANRFRPTKVTRRAFELLTQVHSATSDIVAETGEAAGCGAHRY